MTATSAGRRNPRRVNSLATARAEVARNTSLTLSNVTLAHDGPYDVVATDTVGATVSSTVTLSILLTPMITDAPVSQTVVAGGSVTWSVAATGNPLPFSFEWKRISGNLTLASNTVAGRADFFTLAHVQTNQGGNYRVIVRNLAATNGVAATFLLTVLADIDGDGLPDNWETNYFGDATAADPAADADGDGLLNGQEYIAGTDPLDLASCLKVNRVTLGTGDAAIEFLAVSNHTYTVQFTDGLQPASWQRLADVPARSTNRTETVTDAGVSANRFYRLVTPRSP